MYDLIDVVVRLTVLGLLIIIVVLYIKKVENKQLIKWSITFIKNIFLYNFNTIKSSKLVFVALICLLIPSIFLLRTHPVNLSVKIIAVIINFVFFTIILSGFRYFDELNTIVGKEYKVETRATILYVSSVLLGYLIFLTNNEKYILVILTFIALCLVFIVFRSAIYALNREHIQKFPIVTRTKTLFFYAGYFLLFLQVSIFMFLWSINKWLPGLFTNGKNSGESVNTMDLFYFTFTNFTTFGPGDIKPNNEGGMIILIFVSLSEFIYLLFILNAFIISYTASKEESRISRARRIKRKYN